MSDKPASSLPDEDDFTHYFKATQRLSEENAELRAQLAASQQRVAELEQQLDGSAESIVNEAGKVGQLMNAAAKSATVSVWEQAIVIVKQQRKASRSSRNPPSMNHEHNTAIDQIVEALEAARDAQEGKEL